MSVDATVINRPNPDPYGVRAIIADGEKDILKIIPAAVKRWEKEHPNKEINTAILNKISEEARNTLDGKPAVQPISSTFNSGAGVTPKREPEVRVADARLAGAHHEPEVRTARDRASPALQPYLNSDGSPKQHVSTIGAPEPNESQTQFARRAAGLDQTAPTAEAGIVVTATRQNRDHRTEPTIVSADRHHAPTSVITDPGPIKIDRAKFDRELASLTANIPTLPIAPDESAVGLARNQDELTAAELAQYAKARTDGRNATRLNVGGRVEDFRTLTDPNDKYTVSHFESRANAAFNNPNARVLQTANAIQLAAKGDPDSVGYLRVVAGIESSGGLAGDRPNSNYRSPFQIGGAEVAAQFSKPSVQADAARFGITPALASQHRDHPLVGALAAKGLTEDINSMLRRTFGPPGKNFSQTEHLGLMYASYNQGQGAGQRLGNAVLAVQEGRMDPSTPAWQAMGIPITHATSNPHYFFNQDGTAKTVVQTLNTFTIAAGVSADVNYRLGASLHPTGVIDMNLATAGLPQAKVVAASYSQPSSGPSQGRKSH